LPQRRRRTWRKRATGDAKRAVRCRFGFAVEGVQAASEKCVTRALGARLASSREARSDPVEWLVGRLFAHIGKSTTCKSWRSEFRMA